MTGALETTTVVPPPLPSLVAVIVAVPGDTPVMRPADDTVAIALLLEPHVTTRPVTTAPVASLTVTVGVVVCPTTMLIFVGANVTVPTGTGVTVTTDEPVFPSLVAVMVAVPTATALTEPVEDTVAVAELLELQLTTRSVTTVPFASFTVTVIGDTRPTAKLIVGG